MNTISLRIQCIEDNLASITTATAGEENLQQLKRITNDLDKLLESHQTAGCIVRISTLGWTESQCDSIKISAFR